MSASSGLRVYNKRRRGKVIVNPTHGQQGWQEGSEVRILVVYDNLDQKFRGWKPFKEYQKATESRKVRHPLFPNAPCRLEQRQERRAQFEEQAKVSNWMHI